MKNNANKIILKRNERERKNEKEREKKKIVYYANSTKKKGNYVHEKVNTETDFLPYLVVIDKEQ